MENFILATQTGGILGPFAWILGKILEFIYDGFAALGIYNIGFCIILFTIVVRMLMLPMTIQTAEAIYRQCIARTSNTTCRLQQPYRMAARQYGTDGGTNGRTVQDQAYTELHRPAE